MKKLLVILSLLAVNAYACPNECDMAIVDNECLLSDRLCYEFKDDKTGKSGVKDKSGNIIVPAKYRYIHKHYNKSRDLSKDDYLEVYVDDLNDNDSKGLLDKMGKEIIAPEYTNIQAVQDVIIVQKGMLYGIMDKDGKVLLPLSHNEFDVSRGGIIISRTTSYNLINQKGNIISTHPYMAIINDDMINFFQPNSDGKLYIGIMDKSGKIFLDPIYSTTNEIKTFENGDEKETRFFLISRDDKTFAIFDIKSKKIITPFIYENDRYLYFQEGLLSVKLNDKYGFIDENGKEVIKPIYDYAYGFDAGLAKVKKDGEWFYIDKTGKRVP